MRVLLNGLAITALMSSAQTLPDVPETLKPSGTEKVILQVRAEGDQIYSCDGASWVFKAPQAKLFDAGKQVGIHFAGPTWEWSDGSKVIGKPVANATPDPASIPWLLLKASDHQGEGVMKAVSSIQRVSTKGGKAPGSGCDREHKNTEIRVPYTAVYLFYTLK